MITPSSGFPRPLAGSKDSQKTNTSSSSYHGREMDEKARKEREDKQRKLILQKRQLELKEMDLKTQEDKHGALRREITRLENQSQKTTTVTSGTLLNTKGFENENNARILENEKRMVVLEQEIARLKMENAGLTQSLTLKKQTVEKARKDFVVVRGQIEGHQRLLQQKTQEAVLAVNRINGIKQEIKMIQDRILMLQR